MSTPVTFDELFDAAKETEAFEIEELCFDVSHQLAERLAALAKERGMTQRKIAKTLGVSDVYVSRVLHGNPNLTLATIVKFARALDSRVVPPKIVSRTDCRVPLLVAEAEVGRNTPRSWPHALSDVPVDGLKRPVTSPEKAENGDVPSTAA